MQFNAIQCRLLYPGWCPFLVNYVLSVARKALNQWDFLVSSLLYPQLVDMRHSSSRVLDGSTPSISYTMVLWPLV